MAARSTVTSHLDLEAGGVHDLTLSLPRGIDLTVLVRDQRGMAIGGADVWLSGGGNPIDGLVVGSTGAGGVLRGVVRAEAGAVVADAVVWVGDRFPKARQGSRRFEAKLFDAAGAEIARTVTSVQQGGVDLTCFGGLAPGAYTVVGETDTGMRARGTFRVGGDAAAAPALRWKLG